MVKPQSPQTGHSWDGTVVGLSEFPPGKDEVLTPASQQYTQFCQQDLDCTVPQCRVSEYIMIVMTTEERRMEYIESRDVAYTHVLVVMSQRAGFFLFKKRLVYKVYGRTNMRNDRDISKDRKVGK